jgi:hypothetical protein
MNMQYLILGILEIVWGPYHIFQQFEEYCIALKKPRKNVIPSLGYIVIPFQDISEIHWASQHIF